MLGLGRRMQRLSSKRRFNLGVNRAAARAFGFGRGVAGFSLVAALDAECFHGLCYFFCISMLIFQDRAFFLGLSSVKVLNGASIGEECV